MRALGLAAVLALTAGCAAAQIARLGELEGTTIEVHHVTAIEPGVAVGALAFVQDGKLVGVVGGAVEGGIAGILSLVGKAGSLMGGLVSAPAGPPTLAELERAYVARRFAGGPAP